jgi:hypothetical protein
MGDMLFFTTEHSPVVAYYREQLWKTLTSHPPAVIVLTNEWFSHLPSFDKLKQWPAFTTYLQDNYRIVAARDFPREMNHAYRIYARKDIAVPPLQ